MSEEKWNFWDQLMFKVGLIKSDSNKNDSNFRKVDVKKLKHDSSYLCGVWDYECIIPEGANFPKEKGNAHGGTCIIKMEKGEFCTRLVIRGKRTWHGTALNGEILNKRDIENIKKDWVTIEGAFIDDTRIYYKYVISEEPLDGITFADYLFDEKESSYVIKGQFYYLPSRGQEIDYYEKVLADKSISDYTTIVGTVVLRNMKKLTH